MNKQFLVVWSDGYEPAESRLVALDFFSEDNGYEAEDLEAIDALAEGQELDLSDLGGTHTVTRRDARFQIQWSSHADKYIVIERCKSLFDPQCGLVGTAAQCADWIKTEFHQYNN